MEINISPLNYTNSKSFGGLYTFVPDQAFKDYLLSEGEKTRIVVTNMILNRLCKNSSRVKTRQFKNSSEKNLKVLCKI